eukprot:UN16196
MDKVINIEIRDFSQEELDEIFKKCVNIETLTMHDTSDIVLDFNKLPNIKILILNNTDVIEFLNYENIHLEKIFF